MGAAVANKGRLAAAKEYARKELIEHGDAYELVFHRDRNTGKKLRTRDIINDKYDFDRWIDPNFTSPMSEEHLEKTAMAAFQGDLESERAMIDEVIKYLHVPGLKLPSDRIEVAIQSYAVHALDNYKQLISNSKKRGQKLEKNSARDWVIGSTVESLRSFGFRPTRNRAERQRQSGCSIVADVLASNGLHLSEQAVEKIWRHHGQR
jgi:effector-binding domain-containing protein